MQRHRGGVDSGMKLFASSGTCAEGALRTEAGETSTR